ncbi:MAG: cation-translocating P-type ATPase [Pseudomonadota bacterium]
MNENWHTLDVDQSLLLNGTSLNGLTQEEAGKRFNDNGPNEIPEGKRKTAISIFFDQFKDFLILLLLAAAIVSGVIGEVHDTIAILVIVVVNSIIGFVQEFRAHRAMIALKKLSAQTALVKRGGEFKIIPSRELVPGDIVSLETGNVVPADIRLIEAINLETTEAILTGESEPVNKKTEPCSKVDLTIGSRFCIVFKGTLVSRGRGLGVVVATGLATEVGKIANLIQSAGEEKTPLQKRLAKFGFKLGMATLVICGIVFLTGVVRGEKIILMVLTAISLAVAAVPEALPAVVTISLAFGAQRMVKHNVLIRKLPAVETLGSVTFICSDKTGTITENRMVVEHFFSGSKLLGIESADEDTKKNILLASALCNDATKLTGEPTELALYDAATSYGYKREELVDEYSRIDEIPFDSKRKMMTTLHRLPDGEKIAFTKGAPEVILHRCLDAIDGAFEIEYIQKMVLKLTSEGKRVLALAMKKEDAISEKKLIFLGLAALYDPPRDGVIEAVKECKTAGIIPVMITGDHPKTALAIARLVGIAENEDEIITGEELKEMPIEVFEEKIFHYRVYARVEPEQKLKIIQALQDKGQFVAMTGDGVNDAPALKRADIGIAMGKVGTEVAKESSAMILTDDNFASIVKAAREGRRIYDNIRKFVKYTLGSNSGEIWTIFLAPFLGLPLPLLPIHILWINLVTDGLPGLALTMESEEPDIMNRPPRKPKETLFAHGLGFHVIWVGLLMGAVSLGAQAIGVARGGHWQTMVFTVLCLSQMGHALAIRSEKLSLFKQGLFSNKTLLGAVILTYVLQMAIIYMPFFQPIFRTQALSFGELIFCLIVSTIVFWAVEVEKWIKRRYSPNIF